MKAGSKAVARRLQDTEWRKNYDEGELFPSEDFAMDSMFKVEPGFGAMLIEEPTMPVFPGDGELPTNLAAFPTLRDDVLQHSLPIHPHHALSDRLASGWYMNECRQLESQLRLVRNYLLQRDSRKSEQLLSAIRLACRELVSQWEEIKSAIFLHAGDFYNLQKLEEYLTSTILSQMQLYELDLQRLLSGGEANADVPVCLVLPSQGIAGPIFKEKPLGPFTLRLLTGATSIQIQAGPVQPELVEPTQQRMKRNNSDLEHSKQAFKENGTACFNELKFNSGTFPNLVRLKFRVEVSTAVNGHQTTKTVESVLTDPYISLTNTGSQWKDAAASWLKEDCFKDMFEVTTARFCNYLQKHYLVATKQEIENIKRPLHLCDFDYFLQAKFGVGLDKKTLNQKEFHKLWDWLGPSIKKLRYQKQLLWLFEQGFIPAFVTGTEATEQLKRQAIGTFLVRLSERIDGEFVISYSHQSGVRHYMMQPADTSDKKKTLVDFLGGASFFTYILQLVTTTEGGGRHWVSHQKDKILAKFYKKTVKSPTKNGATNPYDSQLPLGI